MKLVSWSLFVSFKWVYSRFRLEASDVEVKFKNIFRSQSLFLINLVENFKFFFVLLCYFSGQACEIIFILYSLCLWFAVYCWVSSTLLHNQSGYVVTTITNNKVRFLVVCLSGTMRLTDNFSFDLFLFYTNWWIFLDGHPLDMIIESSVDLSPLLKNVFDWSRLHNEVLHLLNPIWIAFTSFLTWKIWKNLG